MKLVYLSVLASSLLFCGCASVSGCTSSGDNKPVAPEEYQNTHSDSTDPVLPAQKPWWKF